MQILSSKKLYKLEIKYNLCHKIMILQRGVIDDHVYEKDI